MPAANFGASGAIHIPLLIRDIRIVSTDPRNHVVPVSHPAVLICAFLPKVLDRQKPQPRFQRKVQVSRSDIYRERCPGSLCTVKGVSENNALPNEFCTEDLACCLTGLNCLLLT
jgi:hypothetical protein